MKILANFDLSNNELQNAVVQNLATAPSNPKKGQIYFNTTSNVLMQYNGTAWVSAGSGAPIEQISLNNQVLPIVNKTVDIPIDDSLSETSTNPVQNSVVKSEIDKKQDVITDLATIRNNATTAVQTITINGVEQTKSRGIVNLPAYPTTLPASDVSPWAKAPTKPSYTASEVGALPESQKGVANGVASLGSDGKVPSSQLPSYVDDVEEYPSISSFPEVGESGKIYVDTSTNKTYRWGGTEYVEISASLALGETSSTAYYGDKGKIAYDHSQSAHAPSNAQKNVQSDWNATSGDAFIKNKPVIPDEVTEATVSGWGFTKNKGTYIKPSTGIPESDLAVAAKKFTGTITGNGATKDFSITHNKNTRNVIVNVFENASPHQQIFADVYATSVNAISVKFSVAPASGIVYKVVIM